MVGAVGFEPTLPTLLRRGAVPIRYAPDGVDGGIRTHITRRFELRMSAVPSHPQRGYVRFGVSREDS